MKPRVACLLPVLLAVLAGCTHTQHVRFSDDADDESTPGALTRAAHERTVRILLLDGGRRQGTNLVAGIDSLHWTSSLLGTHRAVPFDSVHAVEWKRHGRGAGEGAVLGTLIGVPAGIGVGYAVAGLLATEDSDVFLLAVLPAVMLGLTTTVVIIVTSTIRGGAGGSTMRYVINERRPSHAPPPESSSEQGPP